jgi:hypothetical protein
MYKDMAEKTKLEVEGGELLIKSSKGIMAVIPKSHTAHVRELIQKKDYKAVDRFVEKLQPLKRNPDAEKAEEGVMIGKKQVDVIPVEQDTTVIATPGIAHLNYMIAQRIAEKDKIYKKQTK